VRTRRLRSAVLVYAVVLPFVFVAAFPFYWMAQTALKSDADLFNLENNPFGWADGSPTLDHFRFIFTDTQYPTWLANTAIVGGAVVLITLVLSMPAGYALARLSGGWGQTLGVGIFLVYLVPPTLLFLPLSRVVAEVGLQDRLWALILVYPSFTVPFSTWLMMGFFKTIPRELEDAALVDGCSRLRALRYVVFPISVPGLLTVVIFTFALVVNEYVYAITFISTSTERTISAGVPTELIRGDVFFWGSLMAATLLPAIPLALLYNVFLDRFIAGFTGGAFR
jgi:multiple sugar transport system permease protein